MIVDSVLRAEIVNTGSSDTVISFLPVACRVAPFQDRSVDLGIAEIHLRVLGLELL